jgi:archaellum component FlaC|tara:strand:+ start:197 stop:523 length:327 start_codon:yes stop_codon:yes gene_type:complete
MSEEKTYRSVGMAKIDDNFRISLNIKWLTQIIVGVGFIIMGYLRIENRIKSLEQSMESANTEISNLIDKHIEEEEVKIAEMQEQIEWYQKELNLSLNPLSWGKKKRRK